jgi:hypothetical protein
MSRVDSPVCPTGHSIPRISVVLEPGCRGREWFVEGMPWHLYVHRPLLCMPFSVSGWHSVCKAVWTTSVVMLLVDREREEERREMVDGGRERGRVCVLDQPPDGKEPIGAFDEGRIIRLLPAARHCCRMRPARFTPTKSRSSPLCDPASNLPSWDGRTQSATSGLQSSLPSNILPLSDGIGAAADEPWLGSATRSEWGGQAIVINLDRTRPQIQLVGRVSDLALPLLILDILPSMDKLVPWISHTITEVPASSRGWHLAQFDFSCDIYPAVH